MAIERTPEVIDAAIRRHVPPVAQTISREGREACEYILLLPKNGVGESVLIPRETVSDATSQTPHYDDIMQFMDIQGGWDDLLIVISDGVTREAGWVRLPAIAKPS